MRRFLLLFFVSAAICGAPVGAMSQTEIDRAIDGNPGLSAIVRADPSREAQIRARLQQAYAAGPQALHEEALRLGRQFATEMMPKLIGYAPDSAVLEFLENTAVALDEAAAQSGARCHTFLIGGLGGGQMPDFRARTSSNLSDSLARIVSSGADRNRQRLLSEAELGPVLNVVVNRTYEIAGSNPVDFNAVADLMAIRDDKTKNLACWTTIYFYRAILDLPTSDAAALFRTLMAAA